MAPTREVSHAEIQTGWMQVGLGGSGLGKQRSGDAPALPAIPAPHGLAGAGGIGAHCQGIMLAPAGCILCKNDAGVSGVTRPGSSLAQGPRSGKHGGSKRMGLGHVNTHPVYPKSWRESSSGIPPPSILWPMGHHLQTTTSSEQALIG